MILKSKLIFYRFFNLNRSLVYTPRLPIIITLSLEKTKFKAYE